jgi:hypothetical protein
VSARDDVKARIDAIEEAYEFFLAYAAQGLSNDQASKSGGQLRGFLARIIDALDGLADSFRTAVAGDEAAPDGAWSEAIDVLESDAKASLATLRLVQSRAGIGSQLIDNLNANIHLRALLTDLFVLDDLLDQI